MLATALLCNYLTSYTTERLFNVLSSLLTQWWRTWINGIKISWCFLFWWSSFIIIFLVAYFGIFLLRKKLFLYF